MCQNAVLRELLLNAWEELPADQRREFELEEAGQKDREDSTAAKKKRSTD